MADKKPTECPRCREGKVIIFPKKIKDGKGGTKITCVIDCPECDGKGMISINPSWAKEGKSLYRIRINEGVNLRTLCMRYELDPYEVIRVERGEQKATDRLTKIYNSLKEDKG